MKLKPLSDADLKELLAKPLVAKVATHGKEGDIRITPVWFIARDGGLTMNTIEQTELAQNLRRDPRCSVLIDSTQPPDVITVHYRGTATVEGGATEEGIAGIVERYVGPEQARCWRRGICRWARWSTSISSRSRWSAGT
jgi:hypothetical protein